MSGARAWCLPQRSVGRPERGAFTRPRRSAGGAVATGVEAGGVRCFRARAMRQMSAFAGTREAGSPARGIPAITQLQVCRADECAVARSGSGRSDDSAAWLVLLSMLGLG